MGTITARKRGNGTRYTAQIRVKRDGKVVHGESATFGRQALAAEWLRRRETELDAAKARGEPMGESPTIAELIAWYVRTQAPLRAWKRTKAADLKRLSTYPLAERRIARLSANTIP